MKIALEIISLSSHCFYPVVFIFKNGYFIYLKKDKARDTSTSTQVSNFDGAVLKNFMDH